MRKASVLKSKFCHTLLVALLVCSASLCFAQSDKPTFKLQSSPVENDTNAWKEFSSTEAGFSILMPGIPESKSLLINPGMINYQSYGLQTASAGYLVTYSDLPVYSEDPALIKKALDESRESMLTSNVGMKLLSEKEITINGIPGREWLYEYAGKISRQRTIPVKDRLYHLVLLTSSDVAFSSRIPSANADDQTEFYKTTAEKFFGSFKALPRQDITGSNIDKTQTPKVVGLGMVGPASVTAKEGEVDKMLREEKAAGRTVIFGGVMNGKAISLPRPVYPAIAKSARASGLVTVKIVVDEKGTVIAAQAESGHPLLRAMAVKAAREARFSPTRLSNKPVKVYGVIEYDFII